MFAIYAQFKCVCGHLKKDYLLGRIHVDEIDLRLSEFTGNSRKA